MLIEQLRNMEVLLKQRTEHRDITRSMNNLSKQSERLKSIQADWASLTELAILIDLDSSKPIATEFQQTTHVMNEKLMRDFIVKDSDVTTLERLVDDMKGHLTEQWKKQREQRNQNPLLIQARLAFIVGTSAMQMQLRETFHIIQKILDSSLPRAKDFENLEQQFNKLQQLLSTILPEITPETQEFLEKLSQQEASLANITPEVLKWCHEQNLLKKITLRFNAGG